MQKPTRPLDFQIEVEVSSHIREVGIMACMSATELPEMEFPRKAAPRSNEGPPIIFFAHPSIAYDAPERVCRLRRRCAVRTTMKTAATKRN